MERKANRSLQKLQEPQGGKGGRLEAAGLHAHLQCGMHIYITCIEKISIWGEVEKLRGHHLHGGGAWRLSSQEVQCQTEAEGLMEAFEGPTKVMTSLVGRGCSFVPAAHTQNNCTKTI